MLDRFSAKLCTAVAEFDDAGAWRDIGATSMVAWLRHSVGMSGREAARWRRTARRLKDLPVTASAYRDGVLSTGQVQAIVANLNDDIAPLFSEAEDELVARLVGMSVRDTSTVMQSWAAAAKDHLQPDPGDNDNDEPEIPERSLHLSETMDGRGDLTASLDAEGRALTETALRLAESPDTNSETPRPPAQRRADALVDIMRHYLDHQHDQRGGRHRPHLNLVISYDTLTGAGCTCPHCPGHTTPQPSSGSPRSAHTPATGTSGNHAFSRDDHDTSNHSHSYGNHTSSGNRDDHGNHGGGRLLDGTALDITTIRRLACDCTLHRVVMKGRSSILDYGWSTYTPPPNLWAALVIRDHHCRFPGCDRPPQWCEAHHIHPWEQGGPTRLTNLVLLCNRHHHLLHTKEWHTTLHPDGTLEVTGPDGHTRTTRPPDQLPHLFQRPPPDEQEPLAA